MLSIDTDMTVIITISLAAIVTYMLRFGGLLLASKLPNSGRLKRFMDALPGTILLALIAPGILAAGYIGCIATVCTALCAYKTKNVFLSMLIGVTIVAIHRQL